MAVFTHRISARASCLALLCLLAPSAAAARPSFCLPPVFERGQRLQQLPAPKVFWTELMFRQHEICWRPPRHPHELRVALFGNSAILGYPLPVGQTFGSLLNRHFADAGLDAHLYNLGWVATDQLRDAVLIHESLHYRPAVIVYPLTLAEFIHVAPAIFPPQLIHFFESNSGVVDAMLADPPAGLAEPLEAYRDVVHEQRGRSPLYRLREIGSFARISTRLNAEAVAAELQPAYHSPLPSTRGRQTHYDCDQTTVDNALRYTDWQQWNVVAYLQELQRRYGIEVLVVNWPVAHEPVGDCYNVRYTNEMIAQYNPWIAEQARQRGLHFLDLHDLLPADLFFDSLHVRPQGHQLIAERVAAALDPILVDVARNRSASGGADR